MSDDINESRPEAEATTPQEPSSIRRMLKDLRRPNPDGARFVKIPGAAPMTVHATGSSESDPRSKKLIPLRESKAIADQYLASLIAGSKAAQSGASSSSETSNKLLTLELEKAIADRYMKSLNSVSVVTTDDQKVRPEEPEYLTELRKQTLRD